MSQLAERPLLIPEVCDSYPVKRNFILFTASVLIRPKRMTHFVPKQCYKMWERPWWDFVGPIDVDLFRTQVVIVVVLHLRKPNQTEKSPSDRER